MKAVATALLAVAALGYALTLHTVGWLGFVNAACEAAMVGAAADWFAVTALFRHPLGLPIPHTALIPTRKDALGRSLQDFVATHFLAPDVVRGRVAAVGVGRRAGTWLADPPHAERVAGEIAGLGRGAAAGDRGRARRRGARARRPAADARPALGRARGAAARARRRGGGAPPAVDLAADEVYGWLRHHEDVVASLVRDRAPAWTPSWVDERVASRAYLEALRWAGGHPGRPASPGTGGAGRRAPGARRRTCSRTRRRRSGRSTSSSGCWKPGVAGGRRGTLGGAPRRAGGGDPGRGERPAQAAGGGGVVVRARLADDAALQATVDRYAQDAAGYLVTSYRDEVATVISETIERWDGGRPAGGSSCTWAGTCSSSASTGPSWAASWGC